MALKLTTKEQAFCLAVVGGSTLADAYRRAYKPKRAKPKTVHEKASRIMARGKVRARVAELMTPVIAQAQMTRTEWLQWVMKCCQFDPRNIFDETGKLKPIAELDPNEAAAIAGFELHRGAIGLPGSKTKATVKFKFTDRLTALALLGKACGYFPHGQEKTAVGGARNSSLTTFVGCSIPPEEEYRRMLML